MQSCDTVVPFFPVREYYMSDQYKVKDLLPNGNIKVQSKVIRQFQKARTRPEQTKLNSPLDFNPYI